MRVLTTRDAFVDTLEASFQFRAECREGHLDRRQQERRANLPQHRLLVFPAVGVDQVVFEAAELVAVLDIRIAALQAVAEQAVDQEFVAIDREPLVVGLLAMCVQIALHALGQDSGRERGRLCLARRLALP